MNSASVKKRKKWPKVVAVIVIIAVIIAAALGWLYTKADKMLGKIEQHPIDLEKIALTDDNENNLSNFRNIAVLGSDARDPKNTLKTRSDAVIILSLNKKTRKITMVSVLRDSFLNMKDVNGEDKIDKLTHAHRFGGPENTIRTLNENLDLNIKEYVELSWTTIEKMVDAMGGLEFNIEDYEVDEMNRYIRDTNRFLGGQAEEIAAPGKQTLDGIQTVTYCRIRHVGDGDVERASRMRIAMDAVFKKARTLKISELEEVADQVFPLVYSNMSPRSMIWLGVGGLRYDLENGASWPYRFDGKQINGIWYDVPIVLDNNVKALHERLFGEKDYKPSKRVMELSKQIQELSGLVVDSPAQGEKLD